VSLPQRSEANPENGILETRGSGKDHAQSPVPALSRALHHHLGGILEKRKPCVCSLLDIPYEKVQMNHSFTDPQVAWKQNLDAEAAPPP
jgi:hypothetical protein